MKMCYIPHLKLSAPLRTEHSTCVTVWIVFEGKRYIPENVLPKETWMILGNNKVKIHEQNDGYK